MVRRLSHSLVGGVIVVAWIAGCSGTPDGTGAADMSVPRDLSVARDLVHDIAEPPPFCTDAPDGGPPPTLASVETLLTNRCALGGCHAGNGPGTNGVHLVLTQGVARANVVNVMAAEVCGGVLVTPGDTAKSYLFQKVIQPTPCLGGQMPLCEDGSCPLPKCEIEVLRQWIANGAGPN